MRGVSADMVALIVGSQTPEVITSLAMDGKAVWSAAGTAVRKYIRGKEVSRYFNSPTMLVSLNKGFDILESVRGTCDILARIWLTTPRFVRRWG